MDPHIARSDEDASDAAMIECGMCHQRMPAAHTRTLGGRVLCFGCLSGWYEEDDESDDKSSKTC